MIIDTSAVIAVLNQEDDWGEYDAAPHKASAPLMSAATYVGLGLVVDRVGDPPSHAGSTDSSRPGGCEVVALHGVTGPDRARSTPGLWEGLGTPGPAQPRATASPTHWPPTADNRCCSRVRTSARPTSIPRSRVTCCKSVQAFLGVIGIHRTMFTITKYAFGFFKTASHATLVGSFLCSR